MKNVYLTVSSDSRIRDLLRLGTLDYLLEDPEVRVVLVTQADRDPEFVQEFSRERVLIRHLKAFALSRRRTVILLVRWSLKSRRLVDAWGWLERRLFPSTWYDDLFHELPPAVIVLADAIQAREFPLALNARRRNVPTVGLIRSWDNILKRLPVRTQVLVVPNEVNRREAIELELYRESEVEIIGTPQFDPYFQPDVLRPRDEFLRGLGLDPSKRTILLATAGAKFGYIQAEWLDLLLHAQENGELVAPTQIVCRNHPGDPLGPFLHYQGRPGLYLDMPRRWLQSLGWNMTRKDVEEVANLLAHVDLVVSPASTMSLEAAIFDTPAAIIAFNEVMPEITQRVLLESTFRRHFKPLLQEHLFPVAYSREELIAWVNRFLEQPHLYAAERQRIVDLWIRPSDGRSSRRLAELILRMASRPGSRHPAPPGPSLVSGAGEGKKALSVDGRIPAHLGEDLNAVNARMERGYVLQIVNQLGLQKGAVVLDAGCGTGLTAIELLKRGFRVYGVDVAQERIEAARRDCLEAGFEPDAVFRVGDAEELPFEEGTFDLIVAMRLIEHLTWDRWALQEMHRALKPGGHLIITGPNRLQLARLTHPKVLAREMVYVAGKWLRPHRGERTSLPVGGTTPGATDTSPSEDLGKRLYVPSRLDAMLERIGFDAVASVSHGFGPFFRLSQSNRLTLRLHRLLQRLSERRYVPLLRRHGNVYIAVAQKRRGEADGIGRASLATVRKAAKTFEAEHAGLFLRRKQWLKAHPEFSRVQSCELEAAVGPEGAVLVVSPHPDDEIIGCGGTLVRMAEERRPVTVVQLTDGAAAAALAGLLPELRPAVRLKEAQAVAQALGADLVLWKEPDSQLQCNEDNVRRMIGLLAALKPKAVFLPFVNDIHPDHRAASEIVARALADPSLNAASILVLGYEAWSLAPPNVLSNIDAQFDRKVSLLFRYRTGMMGVDYISFCRGLNAHHAYALQGRKGFTEAFFAIDGQRYRDLWTAPRSNL